MRLKPIEKPRGILVRLAYAHCRRVFGRVITPAKVVYARVPSIVPVYRQISRFMTKKVSLDPALLLLIQGYTAGHNKCGFCIDITRSFASHDPVLMEKMWRVNDFATDPLFSEQERAGLAYVAAITRDRAVSDDTFDTLKKHYSDTEIVEITLVNAIEHFYNLVNVPLGIESDGLCALSPATIGNDVLRKAAG